MVLPADVLDEPPRVFVSSAVLAWYYLHHAPILLTPIPIFILIQPFSFTTLQKLSPLAHSWNWPMYVSLSVHMTLIYLLLQYSTTTTLHNNCSIVICLFIFLLPWHGFTVLWILSYTHSQIYVAFPIYTFELTWLHHCNIQLRLWFKLLHSSLDWEDDSTNVRDIFLVVFFPRRYPTQ